MVSPREFASLTRTATRAASLDLDIPRFIEQGLCAQVDPELFFPDQGGRGAEKVCRECPVRVECLEWALAHPGKAGHGVWGGLGLKARRNLARERARQVDRSQ